MSYYQGVSLITPFLHKKTFLYLDNLGEQGKYEIKESLSYFPLYFIQTLMSENKKTGLNRLLDNDPKILLIQEDIEFSYYITNLKIKNFENFTEEYLNEFDFIINTLDNRYNDRLTSQLGLDEKVSSMNLRSEVTYISLKSMKSKWEEEIKWFDQKITELYQNVEFSEEDQYLMDQKEMPTRYGHLDYSIGHEKVFRGVYGPWPLYHIDFTAETFPPWPKIDDLIAETKKKLRD